MTPLDVARLLDHHVLLTFGAVAALIAVVAGAMVGRHFIARARNLQSALDELLALQAAVYAALPFGICVIEDDKHIVSTNEQFDILLEPIMRTSSSDRSPMAIDPRRHAANGDSALIGHLRHEDQDRIVNLDGKRSILVRSTPVPSSVYRVVAVSNVTERSRSQLDPADTTAIADLASLVSAVSITRMSREIRTAVTGIVGMVDLVCCDSLSEQQASYLRKIHDTAYSTLEVVDDMLGLSGVEVGPARETIPPAKISGQQVGPVPARTAIGKQILVAEDNVINREVIESQLARLGYECESAPGGQLALEHWRSGRFALLITDCEMPDVDGFELTRRIRAEEQSKGLPRTPIVAITANVVRIDKKRCRSSGMDDYLAKPFSLEQLRKVIHRQLNEAPGPALRPGQAADSVSASKSEEQPAEDELPSPAVLDLSLLREIYPNNAARIGELIRRFLAIADEIARDIEKLADQLDGDALADASHKLKSSALTSGAFALAEVCRTLEEAGRDSDWPTISLARHQLDPELERIREAIGASGSN